MSQNVVLKAGGIHTNNSPFSATPNGSMYEAVNVVIDRSEVVEPRRGFYQYSLFQSLTKQLINYKDRVLAHVGNELKYDFDQNGLFLNFSGPSVLEAEAGLRIKSIESNGNLYFTTATGVKKISAASSNDFYNVSIEDAGAAKAIDLEANTDYSQLGFLEPNSKVAYRVVFGKTDRNDNLLLGSPSPRVVVYNISETQSCIVNLRFSLPLNINEEYFYQIYRTAISTETNYPDEPIDPGDEMYLVLEDVITSSNISDGFILVNDITPEDFRRSGALLYTNPVSGEGITQANEPPPFAKDICLYKGFTFLANTKTVQRFNLAFLSIVGLVNNVSNIQVSDGNTTEIYLFQGANENFTIDYSACSTSDFVSATTDGKYFLLNSAMNEREYYVWFHDSTNDQLDPEISGRISVKVEVDISDTTDAIIEKMISTFSTISDDFNIVHDDTTDTVIFSCANNGEVNTISSPTDIANLVWSQDDAGTGEDADNNKIFLPRVPDIGENGPTTSQQLEQVAKSLASVLNKKSTIVNVYYMSGFDDVPGQLMFEQRVTTGPAFYLNSNQGNVFNPTLPATGNSASSTNENRPNRIYYSKYQQPDAYPIVNYLDIGPKDREIKRIIALRDSLFVLKEDGIYKISGDTAVAGSSNFSILEFDFSAQVLAPDTAVVLNNQIYALATQGVITISDSGVNVISYPIENQILRIIREGSNYKTASFGVAYESDRSYLLFTVIPDSANGSTLATQVFRYNSFTNTWTKWLMSRTCGLVNFADDVLYLGAGDFPLIEKERKRLNRLDHADREYEVEVLLNGVNSENNYIAINSVSTAQVGDVLLQRQFLTGSQFDRVLRKLDMDVSVPPSAFYDTLKFEAGQNMRTGILNLALKLDADLIGPTDYSGLISNYSDTITDIAVGNQTVITTANPHTIVPTRWVTISGSNSVPSIDGTWEVIATTATTFTINRAVLAAGTSGAIQTAIEDFRDIQSSFNLIVNELNVDPNVFYTNYLRSTGFVDFELIVKGISQKDNQILVEKTQDFMAGDAYIFDSIDSTIIYNPQFFGDPSIEKQVSEGTFMFENSNFSKVTLSYGSDKSPSFVPIVFERGGNGDFGMFPFGTVNWGGIMAPIPLRTYIPLTKQRCRFISIKFNHKVALEKYSLYGVSLTYRPYSIRVSK